MDLLQIAEILGLIIFVTIGVGGFGWFKILKETNVLLKEQNEELKSDNKEWQSKHIKNSEAIAKLQGQIDTIQNIPLAQISGHMDEQTKFMKEVFKFMKSKIKE